MFPVVIPIYIGIIIIIGLLITILCVLIKRTENNFASPKVMTNTCFQEERAVFCKKCATQLDVNQKCCPNCGTPR